MKAAPKTKTMNDVKSDISVLYDELRAGDIEIRLAAELANIAGKYLKAEQLQLAREIFTSHLGKQLTPVEAQSLLGQ
jgi:hypothetical protein